MWTGNKKTEEGIILTKRVEGLPHDSGRAEMEGPILAMQVLTQVRDEYGLMCKTRLGCNNAEVVGRWKEKKMNMLPSKSC